MTHPSRAAAVKVLPAEFSRDASGLRRFEQEAKAVGSLSHPNILAVYDIGVEGGTTCLVSEFLEGETLGSRLRGGGLPIRKALDHTYQTGRGLGAARLKGVVHRDLRPEDLFVTTEGRIKILDFGLAKLVQHPISAVY